MKKRLFSLILSATILLLAISLASADHMFYDQFSRRYIQDNSYINTVDSISSSIDYHSNQERIIIKREYTQSYEPRFKYLVEYKYKPVIYYRYTDVYVHPDYYVYPSNDDRYKRNKYYSRYYDIYDDQYYDSYSLVRVYNKKCDWHSRYYISDC